MTSILDKARSKNHKRCSEQSSIDIKSFNEIHLTPHKLMRTTPDNSDLLIKNNSSADEMAKAVVLITGDGSRL